MMMRSNRYLRLKSSSIPLCLQPEGVVREGRATCLPRESRSVSRMQDPTQAIAEIARRFAASMPGRIATLRASARAETPDAARSLRATAHEIAGIAGCLGFPQTGAAAATLDAMLYRADPSVPFDATNAVEAIVAAFAREAGGQDSGLAASGQAA